MNYKRLHAVQLFAGLGSRDLEAVGRIAEEIDVKAGHVLAREGEFGREFFVIESGTAQVTRAGAHVADLTAGDFFGEMALIEEDRRTATVTAESDMTLVVLAAADFRSLQHTMPGVYAAVKQEIASRRAA